MYSPYSTSTAKSHGVPALECHGPVLREDIQYILPPAVQSIIPEAPALRTTVLETPSLKYIILETPVLKSIVCES